MNLLNFGTEGFSWKCRFAATLETLLEAVEAQRDTFLATYDFEETLGPVMDQYLSTYPDKTPDTYIRESCFITCQLVTDLLTLSSGRKPSDQDPIVPPTSPTSVEVWTWLLRPPYPDEGLSENGSLAGRGHTLNHEGVAILLPGPDPEVVLIDSYVGHRTVGVRTYALRPFLTWVAKPTLRGWSEYFEVPWEPYVPPGTPEDAPLNFCTLEPTWRYVATGLPAVEEMRAMYLAS